MCVSGACSNFAFKTKKYTPVRYSTVCAPVRYSTVCGVCSTIKHEQLQPEEGAREGHAAPHEETHAEGDGGLQRRRGCAGRAMRGRVRVRGERKRLRLYAHQRQNKGAPGKLHMNVTPGDCQSTAHRCALVSSRDQQMDWLRREVGAVRASGGNPRIASKIVVFMGSLKEGRRIVPIVGVGKAAHRVAVVDASMPNETDKALDGFQKGKIHTIILSMITLWSRDCTSNGTRLWPRFQFRPRFSEVDFLARSALPRAPAAVSTGQACFSNFNATHWCRNKSCEINAQVFQGNGRGHHRFSDLSSSPRRKIANHQRIRA